MITTVLLFWLAMQMTAPTWVFVLIGVRFGFIVLSFIISTAREIRKYVEENKVE